MKQRTITEIGRDANERLVKKLIGKQADRAIEFAHFFNLRTRTVRVDGKEVVVTRDHREDRVNLVVVGQTVTEAWLG